MCCTVFITRYYELPLAAWNCFCDQCPRTGDGLANKSRWSKLMIIIVIIISPFSYLAGQIKPLKGKGGQFHHKVASFWMCGHPHNKIPVALIGPRCEMWWRTLQFFTSMDFFPPLWSRGARIQKGIQQVWCWKMLSQGAGVLSISIRSPEYPGLV
jgi:hypothetical protein